MGVVTVLTTTWLDALAVSVKVTCTLEPASAKPLYETLRKLVMLSLLLLPVSPWLPAVNRPEMSASNGALLSKK
jgi:hypothetical protein